MLKCSIKLTALALVLVGLCCGDALAGVNFLPGSGAGGSVRNQRTCAGYNLREPKCNGKACAAGWKCSSCNNAIKTLYKCEQLPTPDGYTAGKQSCAPCQQYSYSGFSGNLINGKCEIIDGCLESASGSGYTSFSYLNGVTISGNSIEKITKTGYRVAN